MRLLGHCECVFPTFNIFYEGNYSTARTVTAMQFGVDYIATYWSYRSCTYGDLR